MREDFQQFWQYKYPAAAEKFQENWVPRTLKTDLDPTKKVARTLRNHKLLILNLFKAGGRLSSDVVEGLNLNSKTDYGKAYGFKSTDFK